MENKLTLTITDFEDPDNLGKIRVLEGIIINSLNTTSKNSDIYRGLFDKYQKNHEFFKISRTLFAELIKLLLQYTGEKLGEKDDIILQEDTNITEEDFDLVINFLKSDMEGFGDLVDDNKELNLTNTNHIFSKDYLIKNIDRSFDFSKRLVELMPQTSFYITKMKSENLAENKIAFGYSISSFDISSEEGKLEEEKFLKKGNSKLFIDFLESAANSINNYISLYFELIEYDNVSKYKDYLESILSKLNYYQELIEDSKNK